MKSKANTQWPTGLKVSSPFISTVLQRLKLNQRQAPPMSTVKHGCSDVKDQQLPQSVHNGSTECIIENTTNNRSVREFTASVKAENKRVTNDTTYYTKSERTCLLCHQSGTERHMYRTSRSIGIGHGRCIENGWQICLREHRPIMSSNENTHLDSFGLPSREALETLYRMTDRVFDSQREKTQENPPKRRHELRRIFNRNLSDRPSQKVYIKLRNKDEDLFDLWSTKLNNCLMKPYKTEIRDAIDDLISKASANVGCKDFAKMIEIYSSHDLVSPAIKMAQTFMFLRNMTEAKIHIRLTDIEMGRSTIFLILIICVSKLVELSEILSFRLMEPIRRISDRPETVAPGPVCIAANLYEQVVDGLLELKRNKVTGLIIKDFDAHFLKVQERLYGIIEYMVSVSCMRTTVLRLLEDVIPRLPSSRRFYLAFWVESSPILQEEIFQEPSNSVGLFLIDEFHKQKEPETQSSRVQNKPEQRHDRPTRSRPQNQSTQSWENDPYFDWLLFSVMTEPSIMD